MVVDNGELIGDPQTDSFLEMLGLQHTITVPYNIKNRNKVEDIEQINVNTGSINLEKDDENEIDLDCDEDDDDEDDEKQSARDSKLMRMGMRMRPLDEEDCAHLERVRDLKEEREHEIQESIESELILFRAARAERQLESENLATDEKNDELKIASEPQHKKSAHVSDDTSKVAEAPTIFPKIMIKKKKRQQIRNSSESDVPSKQQKTSPKSTSSEASFSSENKQRDEKESVENKSKKESDESQKKASNSVLCGLFDGYGSESDSE
eukprot:CAMPEP_0178969138 /NCGR_PEP_ID=MMETSP0789-20121207/18672_1 /TAXON_ID=3005 /ORGANISM="Rhizosolenia setigera, Strain CCMP 1694" /LENGTH=265 /DNA_ID=CAMNT_0020655203 /DNA_START=487 /DNA_END=1285 /DNA_ORIENTATION=+